VNRDALQQRFPVVVLRSNECRVRTWRRVPGCKSCAAIIPGARRLGRILQPKLTEVLGQQVVADNRPGASGNIGVQAAAEATPDGYTFLLGNVSSMGINPSMFPNFPVRALRDFVGLTLVVDVPGALGVHGGLPVGNLKEFIAYAKDRPGKLPYGSAGYGSAQRMAFEFFMKQAGIKMPHVPYKGGAGASTVATLS
jgi:tripartite-type tricarboxylate transporter receptor subunit TctC